MLPVSIESCLARIPNRFTIVKKAAERARYLSMGFTESSIQDADAHKLTVVALMELDQGLLDDASQEEETPFE